MSTLPSIAKHRFNLDADEVYVTSTNHDGVDFVFNTNGAVFKVPGTVQTDTVQANTHQDLNGNVVATVETDGSLKYHTDVAFDSNNTVDFQNCTVVNLNGVGGDDVNLNHVVVKNAGDTSIQTINGALQIDNPIAGDSIQLKHTDDDDYTVRLGKVSTSTQDKLLIGHPANNNKILCCNLWTNSANEQRPQYQIGGSKINSGDLANDYDLFKQSTTDNQFINSTIIMNTERQILNSNGTQKYMLHTDDFITKSSTGTQYINSSLIIPEGKHILNVDGSHKYVLNDAVPFGIDNNASNITSGTLSNDRLSEQVAMKNEEDITFQYDIQVGTTDKTHVRTGSLKLRHSSQPHIDFQTDESEDRDVRMMYQANTHQFNIDAEGVAAFKFNIGSVDGAERPKILLNNTPLNFTDMAGELSVSMFPPDVEAALQQAMLQDNPPQDWLNELPDIIPDQTLTLEKFTPSTVDNIVKKNESAIITEDGTAHILLHKSGSMELLSTYPYVDYKNSQNEDFKVRTLYDDNLKQFIVQGIGSSSNNDTQLDFNITGDESLKPKILINGQQVSKSDLSDGEFIMLQADIDALIDSKLSTATSQIDQSISNSLGTSTLQNPEDNLHAFSGFFKTENSTNDTYDVKLECRNPNILTQGGTTFDIVSQSGDFGLNVVSSGAERAKLYLNNSQISSSDLADHADLATENDVQAVLDSVYGHLNAYVEPEIETLQTQVADLQSSGGGGSSFNPILLLKKTNVQDIDNHTTVKVSFNVIEHQSTDNSITYSNDGDITCQNEGVYEVTADVSFAPDTDVPHDSGVREAFIVCSDYPNEKFGADRRPSPGEGTTNDYTRYTTSCYIKTLTPNSVVSFHMYQNNGDGDVLRILSYSTNHYSRLTVRQVA